MSHTLHDPHKLTPHPLLAGLPAMDPGSAEFDAIKQSIADRGVDYPVLIDEQDRILDGRNRTAACAALGQPVPIERRAAAEAPEIIISALVNRRHLPKAALAYFAAPLLAEAAEAGRQRRLANLNAGKSRNPIQSGIGKTVEQMAAEMGFSADLYEQALKVRKLFANPAKREWHEGAKSYTATAREWFEPKILSGEIGLGGVIQAIAGKDATEGKTPQKRGLPTLLHRALADLKKRFSRWETLSPKVRAEFTGTMAREAAHWPEDVRQAVLASLEEAAEVRPTKPGF